MENNWVITVEAQKLFVLKVTHNQKMRSHHE